MQKKNNAVYSTSLIGILLIGNVGVLSGFNVPQGCVCPPCDKLTMALAARHKKSSGTESLNNNDAHIVRQYRLLK